MTDPASTPQIPKIDRLSVRFVDRDLERAFRHYSIQKGAPIDRFLMISGGVAHILYGVIDFIAVPHVAGVLTANRLITASLIIALWALTYSPWGKTRIMELGAVMLLTCTLSIAAMIKTIGDVYPPYFVGLIMIAFQFSAIGRMDFSKCVGTITFIGFSFTAATWGIPMTSGFIASLALIYGTFLSCIMGNYLIETNRRTEYILHRDRERYFRQVQELADDAEKSVQRKNALLNVLGHVVKTPLHQIIGYAQIIEQTAQMPDTVQDTKMYADEISRAGTVLSHQSQRILEYARADAGLLVAQSQKTNARRMLGEALYRHQEALDEKCINLSNTTCETSLETDPRHVSRAIDELLDNAVRYCPPGSDLTLSSKTIGGKVALIIQDTGPGIPEGDIDRIVDAMNKTQDFRNLGGDKLGIGIALARTLCHLSGAEFYFASIPNHGSLATIVFDRVQCTAATQETDVNVAASA